MPKPVQILIVVASLLFAAHSLCAESLTDPYTILNRHYQAMGGLEKIKAQKTAHLNGELVLQGTGLQGTFERWSEDPIRHRQEVDLKVIKQVSGDNGEYAWIVDPNGKLQIRRDEQSLTDRRLEILMAEYAHLDPNSNVFTLSFVGIDTALGTDCYLVEISNSLNEDTTVQYYDTTSFMLKKNHERYT